MKISSSAFEEGGSIPKQFAKQDADKSPPLNIEDVPEQARSLVLIMDDPDATSGTFTHWILFNVSPRTKEVHEDSPPVMATQGRNDYGDVGYGGPKPPSGEHRYFFKLYALDSVLPLSRGAKRQQLEALMEGHVLEEAETMGRFAAEELAHA